LTAKFPLDTPTERVIRALQLLGITLVREGKHIAMQRTNADGTITPITIPNHRHLKSSTVRTMLNQAGIGRDDFLRAYEQS
jgi:hypothetical protein